MADYAKPEVLVSTEWLEERLDDPSVRVIEVDEDTAAYDKGHIRGAVKWDWTTDLHAEVGRDFQDQAGFSRLLIDPGIGFGKTQDQNLELIAKLDQLIAVFPDYPLLIGTSRKSFIGRILADESGTPAPPEDRLHGTMATITASILHGAHIVRVHDVKAAVETIRVARSIRENPRPI